jgi:glutamine amidotransferase
VLLEDLLLKPQHSLIDQSLHSRLGATQSLFYSTRVDTLREQHPDNPVFQQLSDESRIVVSEPLGDLACVWNEVPESPYGIVQEGPDELPPFTPRPSA